MPIARPRDRPTLVFERNIALLSLFRFVLANMHWLAAGFLLTFASSFGQTFFISVFAGDIQGAYGLSHAGWGGIYAVATMASAGVMVFAGGLTDRFRLRGVGVAVLVGLAAATLLMSLSHAIWSLVLAVFLLRLMGQGMMGHAAMVAMSRWFVATRGRAVAIAGLGVAMGEATLPLLFVALKSTFDWRSLWLVATSCLLLFAAVLFPLLRRERTPQSFIADSGNVGMLGRNWTRSEVLRDRLFWLTLPAIMGPAAWNTAFYFHQVHFAETKGWAHLQLVALFPVLTVTGIASMLATGWLVDRVGANRLAGLYLLPCAAGYAVMWHASTIGMTGVAMVLMGLSIGASSTLASALWAEVYGTAHIGRIRAMISALMVLGSAVGPGLTGWLIDLGFSMPDQCIGIAAYFMIAAALGMVGGRGAGRLLATPRSHDSA